MDVQRMKDELLLKQGGVKAQVTPMGFYSPLEEAAYKIQRKAGNAQAFMNDLRTVPKDQLQHAGVDKLLTSKPTLTREEVQRHISQAAPRVEVVMRRKPDLSDLYEERPGVYRLRGRENIGWFRNPREAEEHLSEDIALPRYEEYTLPGGNNYREMLLTLPPKKGTEDQAKALAGPAWERMTPAQRAQFMSYPTKDALKEQYRTHHWKEPNVLAHIRMNDRTDPDGKKVLFVEEIQSDWGQEGKKQGFGGKNVRALSQQERERLATLEQRDMNGFTLTSEERTEREALAARRSEVISGNIPSAPFATKTNDWVNLALKHILKTAAQEGHDKVAFVRGDQAADRFGLDKQFSSIEANPVGKNAYELRTTQKDGTRETSVNVPHDKLHEYVGEDLAQKIHSQGGGYFEGDNLKMPQKGIRKFYDELVPAQAQGLISKLGGKLDTVQIPQAPKGLSWPSAPQKFSEHPGFEITPQMRQAILKPMAYAKGGRVPTMDQMRLALMDQKFPQMGINVTTDKSAGMRYADLIVDGKKQYETRDSDSLRPYVGKRVAIVRTGEGPAKAIGAVTVGEPMTANPKKFRAMQDGHLVPEGSRFDIKDGLKYLYPMIKPERFDEEQDVGHGIVSRRLIRSK